MMPRDVRELIEATRPALGGYNLDRAQVDAILNEQAELLSSEIHRVTRLLESPVVMPWPASASSRGKDGRPVTATERMAERLEDGTAPVGPLGGVFAAVAETVQVPDEEYYTADEEGEG